MHLFPRRSTIAILLLSVIAHASNAQWTTLDLNTDEFFFSVDYRSDGSVWIGAQDTLHHSLNSGTSFVKRPVEFPPGVPLLASYGAIHAFDPNTAVISGFVALGDAEVILRTTDAGVAYSIVHQQEVGLLD